MGAELTKSMIDSLVCPDGKRDIIVFDTKLTGFAVRVTRTGSKVFLIQYKRQGQTKRYVIGQYGVLTLPQARKRALELLGDLAGGIDPVAARQEAIEAQEMRNSERKRAEASRREAEAFTCRVLVDRWCTIALADRSPNYRLEAPRAILTLLGPIADEPVSALTVERLQGLIDIKLSITPTLTVNFRAYGRAAWNWALGRRLVNANPFADVVIEKRLKPRERVLSDPEIAEVWREAGTQPYPFGPMIRLLLLTLQRRSEVAGMRWSELSDNFSTWTLPSVRAKNRRAHIVHLAEPARAILLQLADRAEQEHKRAWDGGIKRDRSDYVFTTTGETAAANVQKGRRILERRIALARKQDPQQNDDRNARRAPELDWRLHDFRRTGVTKLAELGVAPHVADRILNHTSGAISGVAAIYQKFDFQAERKRALDIWANHILSTLNEAYHSEKILTFSKSRPQKNLSAK